MYLDSLNHNNSSSILYIYIINYYDDISLYLIINKKNNLPFVMVVFKNTDLDLICRQRKTRRELI
jgi:hypothetical protein